MQERNPQWYVYDALAVQFETSRDLERVHGGELLGEPFFFIRMDV